MKVVDTELRLRYLTVDKALVQLDPYLNGAFVAHLPFVCIVHGRGVGTLGRAIRRVLAKHPLLKCYRLGDYGEGDP